MPLVEPIAMSSLSGDITMQEIASIIGRVRVIRGRLQLRVSSSPTSTDTSSSSSILLASWSRSFIRPRIALIGICETKLDTTW